MERHKKVRQYFSESERDWGEVKTDKLTFRNAPADPELAWWLALQQTFHSVRPEAASIELK